MCLSHVRNIWYNNLISMLGRWGDFYDWKWITTAGTRHDLVLPVFLPRFFLKVGGHVLRVQANWSPLAEQRHTLQSCWMTEPGSHTWSKKGKICFSINFTSQNALWPHEISGFHCCECQDYQPQMWCQHHQQEGKIT